MKQEGVYWAEYGAQNYVQMTNAEKKIRKQIDNFKKMKNLVARGKILKTEWK